MISFDLNIYDLQTMAMANSWFISNERISLKNRLFSNPKLFSPFQLSSRFYKSVRRLKLIVKIICNQVTLGWLEKFEQLKQLEIYEIISQENVLISLPGLKKLYIYSFSGESSFETEYLVFNTPKLTKAKSYREQLDELKTCNHQ